ncbi:hypothetical protein KKH26_03100 [Patescibacteria group bacterium]|nr:hypothetical protein [Patescibacteria group bacterium]
MNQQLYQEIISEILAKKIVTKDEIHKIKLQFCRKYNLDKVPSDPDILSNVDEKFYPVLESVLRKKPDKIFHLHLIEYQDQTETYPDYTSCRTVILFYGFHPL